MNFSRTKLHVEKNTANVNQYLAFPSYFFMFLQTALILEEIAIDSFDDAAEARLLEEALLLHEDSLALSRVAFGEHNVQTAKHYGNLGRLYQTLQQWEVRVALNVEFLHRHNVYFDIFPNYFLEILSATNVSICCCCMCFI